MLDITSYALGPVLTNSYLVADKNSGEAVVIDPADEGYLIATDIKKKDLQIKAIWLTQPIPSRLNAKHPVPNHRPSKQRTQEFFSDNPTKKPTFQQQNPLEEYKQ